MRPAFPRGSWRIRFPPVLLRWPGGRETPGTICNLTGQTARSAEHHGECPGAAATGLVTSKCPSAPAACGASPSRLPPRPPGTLRNRRRGTGETLVDHQGPEVRHHLDNRLTDDRLHRRRLDHDGGPSRGSHRWSCPQQGSRRHLVGKEGGINSLQCTSFRYISESR